MGELPQGPQWVGWEGTALGVPVCCVVVAVSPYPLVPPCTPMSHIPVSPGPHIPRTWSDSRGGGAGGGRGDPTYPMAPPIPWPHPLVTPPPPFSHSRSPNSAPFPSPRPHIRTSPSPRPFLPRAGTGLELGTEMGQRQRGWWEWGRGWGQGTKMGIGTGMGMRTGTDPMGTPPPGAAEPQKSTTGHRCHCSARL